MNQTSMTSALLEKLGMTCGDFIDLLAAWENSSQKRQKESNLNSKKARISTPESDIFKTPPAVDNGLINTKKVSSWTSSV